MTEEERNAIDPGLCAEGLRYILHKYTGQLDFCETAVIVGAILLLRDKRDDYPYQVADEAWKGKIITQQPEIIHCRDCFWFRRNNIGEIWCDHPRGLVGFVEPSDYCSKGVRRKRNDER